MPLPAQCCRKGVFPTQRRPQMRPAGSTRCHLLVVHLTTSLISVMRGNDDDAMPPPRLVPPEREESSDYFCTGGQRPALLLMLLDDHRCHRHQTTKNLFVTPVTPDDRYEGHRTKFAPGSSTIIYNISASIGNKVDLMRIGM